MAIQIVSGKLTTGKTYDHVFNNRVISAGIGITEYKIGYTLGQVEVGADAGQDSGHLHPHQPQKSLEQGNKQATSGSMVATKERSMVPAVDHHVKTVSASVSILNFSGEKVTVKADGYIEDNSGNKGGGEVTYTLFVETE